MSEEIHKRFLKLSKKISTDLHQAIKQVGVVELSSREFIEGRTASLPELLCRSVVGQQLSNKAADTIWRRILALADEMPLLDYIHNNDAEPLRSCGASGAKAKSMAAIAEAFISGTLKEKELKKLDEKDRSNALMSIWGVGPWTADMANLFYFLDTNIWPEKDIAAVNTFQRLIGEEQDMKTTAAKFSPHRSYLALIMWRISDQPASND